ncbi:hypothetical protein EBY67_06115 [bacterium]|nr:hypothetical protein [bacterium]
MTNLLHQSYPFAFDYYQRFLEQHKALGQNYPLWQQLDEQAERMQGFIAGSSDWFGLETGGILFKRSMVLDMPALCQTLLSHQNISLYFNEMVEGLNGVLGTKLQPEYFECPYPFYQPHTEADMSATERDLKIKPKFSLEQGLADYEKSGWLTRGRLTGKAKK